MFDALKEYIIFPSMSLMEALKKIDSNRKGFLIVIDDNNVVIGTLTDGDIRRSFINGYGVNSSVYETFHRNCTVLHTSENISGAIDVFKSQSIKFIPIVDEKSKLANILTKHQLHALILQDIKADLNFDFSILDEGIVDHEIFQRPWGFYKTTVMNDYFQSKVISVNPKGQLSLQSHNQREEYWIVAHGIGIAQIGESILDVKCGSSLFIPKGCKHRLTNTDENESLIITEVQIGDYFGEDDIIRYEDIYGRV